jgi:hypothetical protein
VLRDHIPRWASEPSWIGGKAPPSLSPSTREERDIARHHLAIVIILSLVASGAFVIDLGTTSCGTCEGQKPGKAVIRGRRRDMKITRGSSNS